MRRLSQLALLVRPARALPPVRYTCLCVAADRDARMGVGHGHGPWRCLGRWRFVPRLCAQANFPSPSPSRRVVSDPMPMPPSAAAASTESHTWNPLPPLPSPPPPPIVTTIPGRDKARLFDMVGVRGDARIQPQAGPALQRAVEDETEFEVVERERSIRDPATDFAARVAALKCANVKIKLVSVVDMDRILDCPTPSRHDYPRQSSYKDSGPLGTASKWPLWHSAA